MLLATWNIRDFGADGKFGSQGRLSESFYYLAETIANFDLVALQEVSSKLRDFERLMDILGSGWDYILTDATEGTGGNGERMAFVYNRDKVWFRRTAGEIVLPKGQLIVPASAVEVPKNQTAAKQAIVPALPAGKATDMEGQQFARTPFLVSFQSGWFRFNLCTVHIYYGSDSGIELQRRIDEIEALVNFFAKRQDKESKEVTNLQKAENYILLGDFNVVSPEHETMSALTSRGFTVPKQIDGDNLPNRDHFYDQIAVRVKDNRFKTLDGGIVDIYENVFTVADMPLYLHLVPENKPNARRPKTPIARYEEWRTWQMSDHKPLWVEIQTDFSDAYLQEIGAAPKEP
ncbi:endonuclease/exonuclease/phosphatase family protein [Salinibacterium sp. G-O1]|uniref:endonuclease/exonuclease/phosphatase family protein n=1 Tax=Salinibacterium sp. G-O1 TaxID=3046208 RepID=UPI0024BB3A26|nr:endonuclease/exonuclease/phosphatase family protein [Salinibacterium sp. G-O1]MDJ0334915.1 endonuclease/exonuclease/phosphatase family protein [Salinibacterium sp. G-O1]